MKIEFIEKGLLLKFIKDFNLINHFNLNNNFYKIEYRILFVRLLQRFVSIFTLKNFIFPAVRQSHQSNECNYHAILIVAVDVYYSKACFVIDRML